MGSVASHGHCTLLRAPCCGERCSAPTGVAVADATHKTPKDHRARECDSQLGFRPATWSNPVNQPSGDETSQPAADDNARDEVGVHQCCFWGEDKYQAPRQRDATVPMVSDFSKRIY